MNAKTLIQEYYKKELQALEIPIKKGYSTLSAE